MFVDYILFVQCIDMGGYVLIENVLLVYCNMLCVVVKVYLLVEICDVSKLFELLVFFVVKVGLVLVLGEGSNVLFVGDYFGIVLVMVMQGVQVEVDGDIVCVVVVVGECWDDFVCWMLGQGLVGLENFILIFGIVGVVLIQNIGVYGIEVVEFIESVEVWDMCEYQIVMFDYVVCVFGYCDLLFKCELGCYIVIVVCFVLLCSYEL